MDVPGWIPRLRNRFFVPLYTKQRGSIRTSFSFLNRVPPVFISEDSESPCRVRCIRPSFPRYAWQVLWSLSNWFLYALLELQYSRKSPPDTSWERGWRALVRKQAATGTQALECYDYCCKTRSVLTMFLLSVVYPTVTASTSYNFFLSLYM